jgi:hypothetical protein
MEARASARERRRHVEAVGLILGWWCAASVVAATSWSVLRTIDKRRRASAERQRLLAEVHDVRCRLDDLKRRLRELAEKTG